MFSENYNDTLANLVKANPELEGIIQNMVAENKKSISMFVHELRNPLSLIKSTLQYIETKHPETKDYKYWDQLQDLIYDLEHMMADASLLNTYTMISKETSDLLSLISSLKNSFMPQAANHQVDLELILKEGCEPYFSSYSFDPAKMKQVLSNLIKNAFEATTPGNFIRIILSYLPNEDSSAPKLSIVICNNGSPIPEEIMDKIFLPFVTYKKGGTGIGLAIVKKIIDLHYGSISVASNEKLTSFTILLPL